MKSELSIDAINVLIGKNIAMRRKQLGLTRFSLASSIGVSAQQVQKYETGKNSVVPPKLKAISETLQIDINSLFYDIESFIYEDTFPELKRDNVLVQKIIHSFLRVKSPALKQQIYNVVATMVRTEKEQQKNQNI